MAFPSFGTDGVRGTYGKDLFQHYVYALGRAIATSLGVEVPFDIGRDTRTSGPDLFVALSAGLIHEGAKVNDLGILPTPAISMLAKSKSHRACVITASHNPAQDNGIKVFDVGGKKITKELEVKIETSIKELGVNHNIVFDTYKEPDNSGIGTESYLQYLEQFGAAGSLDGIRVVLDCANGAAYRVGPAAFETAGAQVIAINTEADGKHINENCGATHLDPLIEEVQEQNADIGFAFDGDADRIIAVDDNGIIRDGDCIIALFALEMKASNQLNKDAVVATGMSNGALKKFLNNNDISFHEVPVGDKYVLDKILKENLSLGGEQSGHIIRTDVATWGDGVINALLIAQIFTEKRRQNDHLTSFELFDLFIPLKQLHDKISVNHKGKAVNNDVILASIRQEIKSLGEPSRVIIRPSGTEDVVRITVEGLDENSVRQSLERLGAIVKEVCE